MSIFDDANQAFERGDLGRVRELLEPTANAGDREAQTALGTLLVTDGAGFIEGVRWLTIAADAGYGHAAHNLATILWSGGPGVDPDQEKATRYMQTAVDSGFEATVSCDPHWWSGST